MCSHSSSLEDMLQLVGVSGWCGVELKCQNFTESHQWVILIDESSAVHPAWFSMVSRKNEAQEAFLHSLVIGMSFPFAECSGKWLGSHLELWCPLQNNSAFTN